MADASVAQKLKYKPGMVAALLHVPAGVDIGVPAASLVGDPAQAAFVLEFAATQMEAEARLLALAPSVGEKTVVWIGYPKGSRAAGLDLNRDTVAAAARTVGLVVNASISIDGTWSALRLRPLRPGE